MKTTAIYLRVSTVDQNAENQQPDLARWCRANDLPAPPDGSWLAEGGPKVWQGSGVTWYADEFTGKVMSRPQWSQLAAQLEAGKLERIVAWRIDRFGRTAAGLHKLFDQCTQAGVNIITLKDGVDLSTPVGRLFAGILASMAQFELETMRQRHTARITLDRARQREAYDLHSLGRTPAVIARKLGIADTRRHTGAEIVRRMLSKPIGTLWWGGRAKGVGTIETCTPERVAELLAAGLTIPEIARATGAHERTVYRRIRTISQP